ncbi:MAG: cupin domain-containing protein [Dehalococcoidia bacterium]
MQHADNINQIAEFISGGRAKKDIFKGEYFNVVAIYLDSGAEIPPHEEPYDVFFYVVSGKGMFTVGEEQWEAETGSIVFAPKGIRGVKCIERLTILGIQEPH